MTPTDLRILCTALGFTAVVMQGGRPPKKESNFRAAVFAGLIEEFCRATLPDVFGEVEKHSNQNLNLASPNSEPTFSIAERMANAIADIYKETGNCLPHDLMTKGFAQDEIDRHWAMANALAHVETEDYGFIKPKFFGETTMSRTTKAKQSLPIAKVEKLPGKKSAYTLLPWSCTHYPNHSEIEAYLLAAGDRQTIAKIHDATGVDAEHLAEFIVRAVNAYEKHLNRDSSGPFLHAFKPSKY